jgi:hypothetical protein
MSSPVHLTKAAVATVVIAGLAGCFHSENSPQPPPAMTAGDIIALTTAFRLQQKFIRMSLPNIRIAVAHVLPVTTANLPLHTARNRA